MGEWPTRLPTFLVKAACDYETGDNFAVLHDDDGNELARVKVGYIDWGEENEDQVAALHVQRKLAKLLESCPSEGEDPRGDD